MDRLGINPVPLGDKSLGRVLRFLKVASMTDAMKRAFDFLLIRSLHIIEYITGFVGPTTLNRYLSIDQRQRGQQPFASIHDDEFKALSLKPSLVEVIQKSFPGGLRFPWSLTEVDDLLLPIGFDPQGHQHRSSLGSDPRFTLHDDAIKTRSLHIGPTRARWW